MEISTIFNHWISTQREALHQSRKLLRFVDRASRCNRVKKTQLDAQLIRSIFRQPLHVSGVSRPIIRRFNRIYTTFGNYYSF